MLWKHVFDSIEKVLRLAPPGNLKIGFWWVYLRFPFLGAVARGKTWKVVFIFLLWPVQPNFWIVNLIPPVCWREIQINNSRTFRPKSFETQDPLHQYCWWFINPATQLRFKLPSFTAGVCFASQTVVVNGISAVNSNEAEELARHMFKARSMWHLNTFPASRISVVTEHLCGWSDRLHDVARHLDHWSLVEEKGGIFRGWKWLGLYPISSTFSS